MVDRKVEVKKQLMPLEDLSESAVALLKSSYKVEDRKILAEALAM